MADNNLYIACIDLSGRDCLVVGAGTVALEKIEGLLAAGAKVTVVAPEAVEEIVGLSAVERVTLLIRAFEPGDVKAKTIVIAATSDNEVNRRVYAVGREQGALVNVADVPQLCDFILPAIHRDGPLAVAVSTNGASPALAQRMRREASERFDAAYAELANILEGLRPWAKENLPTYRDRKRFFDSIVEGDPDPIELLRADDRDILEALIETRRRDALAGGIPVRTGSVSS